MCKFSYRIRIAAGIILVVCGYMGFYTTGDVFVRGNLVAWSILTAAGIVGIGMMILPQSGSSLLRSFKMYAYTLLVVISVHSSSVCLHEGYGGLMNYILFVLLACTGVAGAQLIFPLRTVSTLIRLRLYGFLLIAGIFLLNGCFYRFYMWEIRNGLFVFFIFLLPVYAGLIYCYLIAKEEGHESGR